MAKRASSYTVGEFCNNPNWSEATRKNYYYALLHFARFMFPGDQAVEKLNKHVRTAKDPAKDIEKYARHMQGKPPKTISLYMTAVRSFYSINGHVFNKQEMKRVIPKTGDAETAQGILTTEILKKMVDAADFRTRVLIMLLASTGCRIGELCAVKISDVHLERDPVCINLKKEYTKNGRRRAVFLTDEARDILNVWLKSERIKHLQASYARNEGLNDRFRDHDRKKPEEDDRLLGVTTGGARQAWYTVLDRLKDKDLIRPDAKTRIHPFTPHTVRKWFRTNAIQGIKNPDICNILLGHWDHGLDQVYVRYGDAGLGQEFKKGQAALSILSSNAIKSMQEKVEKTDSVLLTQAAEIKKLKEELENTQKQFQEFSEMALRVIQDADANREYQFNLMRDPNFPPPIRLEPHQVQKTWDRASIEAAKRGKK